MTVRKMPIYSSTELSSAFGTKEELSSACIALTLQKTKSPILKNRSAARGVMSMRTNIEIHDDYCSNMNSAEVEAVLSQVTALITDAVLRATYQSEDAA